MGRLCGCHLGMLCYLGMLRLKSGVLRLKPGDAKAKTKTSGVHAELPACDASRQARQGVTTRRVLPSIPDTSANVPQQVSAT